MNGSTRRKLSLYLNLIRLDRPIGWLLLIWPTLASLWMAAEGWPGWHLLTVFALGTVLMRSAGCCINDVADRNFDRYVKRTAGRPVTTGALAVREALLVGALLALMAFLLVLTTNELTVQLAIAALAIALVYPFSKRFISVPQAVLGIAFSFGIPMAFAATLDRETQHVRMTLAAIPDVAWVLMASNLFYVLAYDTVYAMVDRDDDIHVGIQTSALTLGRFDVQSVMAFYGIYLLGWTLIGLHLGMGNYFRLGAAIAALQIAWQNLLVRTRTREDCFKAFRMSHWIGFSVFLGTAVDLALR
ncbi:4-hydroxybenzoate octaprenyltransferase [Paucibacter sp. R3-3]|uniref:4-hydroxybenzoate octaprenyltransferase n=1 Tax=Roseateles agri TaxID=3098619 RepID=A0ABU5DRW3_9BURK|nr:4-hydroxybenzoate octaprenyltransferase [Paucibacter sp. R3-3]MDY0749065.1 4-hydroxybenzoate octaprenyltransferase [Paucibacter sp. R3-3]